MSDMELSPERREELLSLLDNESRLKTEYPKLAEYLDIAPSLSGTGNDQRDGEFDLRLIEVMTRANSTTQNPYWEIVAPAVSDVGERRVIDGGNPKGSPRLAFAQTVLQDAYAFAILAPETVQWVSEVCGSQTIVELGAGRGYWAKHLRQSGVTIDAYDIKPPTSDQSETYAAPGVLPGTWADVDVLEKLEPDELGARTLLLCWPPGWGDTMASEALKTFEDAGGEQLIYVGEPQGGKTGDDLFFDGLAARWRMESKDPNFVSWWNNTDGAQAWTRTGSL
ncbi:hypothetical protein [Stackebrandtia nassauensis]|uniref:Methyltransferase type 11 n=1 Tax=Stackebrandtia nassauensis (strain DSM 44728 / CIP 108903 / NRRL B-16338 / NBRC 102104 / LLR-40K-21) TaxID=446470 RepID=D3Q968_STANL|nr:hypothetical protein [Stackebrandtia nassauensis]ADD40677.1 hypothetical protein Snas_0967 [Stackebrandtia nassauensis DSM 44728]